MVGALEKFGHFSVARRADGSPVELLRSPDELVFLAFDTKIKRLVELHILRSGNKLDSVAKQSAFERSNQAAEIRGPTFLRILHVGEDQGLVYYTSNLNDGEFASDYVARRGALAAATVFALVVQMLDDLIKLQGYERLVTRMRLDRVMISTLEDTFLHLRICDYGLSADASTEPPNNAHLVIQACQLIFLLLTGKQHNGENPDRFPTLTSLPMSLRLALRTSLTDPSNAPVSLEKLRDDVREGFSALVGGIQARNTRKQIVVIPALQPRSQLQDLLLENVPVETILGSRFRSEDHEDGRRYPFSIPAIGIKTEQPVTVHLLPPSRVVDKSEYEAVPLQMWRFNPERHPNILRSLSLWESPEWTFLTEEREPGFALSRLMAERLALNPNEAQVLLKQISAGLDQALECGVARIDLHPSNVMLCVGKKGPLQAREHERLIQKRIDVWPSFLVKLRPHLTMRNLYEPLLVDRPEDGECEEEHLADRDYRNRAFIALAVYLLTGERQSASGLHFAESVPEPLAVFVREALDQTRFCGQALAPSEFLDQFDKALNAPAGPDLASRLRGQNVALEDMESAGSISDFDNEWSDPNDTDWDDSSSNRTLKAHEFNVPKNKGALSWPLWAAGVTVLLLAALGWWWLGSSNANTVADRTDTETAPPAVAPSAQTKEPESELTSTPDVPGKVRSVVGGLAKPDPEAPAPSSEATRVTTTSPSVDQKPATTPPAPAVAPVTTPPPAPTSPDFTGKPVIIRKAIVPTPEELQELKSPDEQARNKTGTIPTISPARATENLADSALR